MYMRLPFFTAFIFYLHQEQRTKPNETNHFNCFIKMGYRTIRKIFPLWNIISIDQRPNKVLEIGLIYFPSISMPLKLSHSGILVIRLEQPNEFRHRRERNWCKAIHLINYTKGQTDPNPGRVLGLALMVKHVIVPYQRSWRTGSTREILLTVSSNVNLFCHQRAFPDK